MHVKMSIQYMVPGFELTTFGTWVFSHNHYTRAAALLHTVGGWFKIYEIDEFRTKVDLFSDKIILCDGKLFSSESKYSWQKKLQKFFRF